MPPPAPLRQLTPAPALPPSGAGRRRWPLALGLVLLLHLALVARFAPPAVMLGEEPLYTLDHALHYYQVVRAQQAFEGWGKLWGYDPLQIAGHPAGALEDINNKAVALFVIGLSHLGVASGRAYNLFVLLVHLLLPLAGFFAARLWRLTPAQATLAALLWVLLWFFDSLLHWLWFCGMVSWALGSYLVLVVLGLLYRALEERRQGYQLALIALTSLLALLHPFLAIPLLPAALWLYLRDLRRLSWRDHALILAAGVAALSTAALWLLPALRLSHYLLDADSFLRPTLGYLISDYFDLLWDAEESGSPVRTMVRFLCLAAAAVVLWRWRCQRDRRFAPLALLIIGGVLWAYGGGYFWLTRQTQPYRLIAPAMLAAALPAALLLCQILSPAQLRAAPRAAQIALLLALLMIVPRFGRNVLYYFPELLPSEQESEPGFLQQRGPSMLAGFGEPRPFAFRHKASPAGSRKVRAWLEKNLDGAGRVVVQDFMMGEYLAATSGLPILGGLRERAVGHADAHLFRLDREAKLPEDTLRRYFERYAVRYVVVSQVKRHLEWRKELLSFKKLIDGTRIYQTKIEPSYFLRGSGRVVEQAFNRILVDRAQGPEVVLRFHWLETLRCRPDCRLERFAVEGDRVGFIRVPDPPARFEIYNSYRFE